MTNFSYFRIFIGKVLINCNVTAKNSILNYKNFKEYIPINGYTPVYVIFYQQMEMDDGKPVPKCKKSQRFDKKC